MGLRPAQGEETRALKERARAEGQSLVSRQWRFDSVGVFLSWGVGLAGAWAIHGTGWVRLLGWVAIAAALGFLSVRLLGAIRSYDQLGAVLRKRLQELGGVVSRQQVQMAALHSMSAKLGGSLQRDQILSNVRLVMNGMVPCLGGFLFIRDVQSGQFKLTGSIGGKDGVINTAMVRENSFTEEFQPIVTSLSSPRPAMETAWDRDSDFLKVDAMDELVAREGDLSRCCMPLRVNKELLGVAVFYGKSEEMRGIDWENPALGSMVNLASVALGSAIQNELAVHDRLTRLYNHGYFHEELAKAMEEARGYLASGSRQGCVSLILMDIDHFKRFNDSYGHQTGDAVLKQLAEILRSQCNPYYETAARYGGEEFALIMRMAPLTSESVQEAEDSDLIRLGGAVAKAETIRRRVEETAFGGAGEPLRVTVSLGVGCWRYPQDEEMDKASFVKIVDDRLYAAKRAGRNQVCFSS